MEYSKKQQIISEANRKRKDKYYIQNKREEGQKRIFKCSCCGKDFDFSGSMDYVGAVDQWEQGGGNCYACAHGFCHCKEGEAHSSTG